MSELTIKFKDKILKGKVYNTETYEVMDSSFSFLSALRGELPGVRIHEIMQEIMNQIAEQTGFSGVEVIKPYEEESS